MGDQDIYEYSDGSTGEGAASPTEMVCRRMSPSELQIVPVVEHPPSPQNDEDVLYNPDAFWNVLPPAQHAGNAARARAAASRERFRGRAHPDTPKYMRYVPDAFDGKTCRVEMYGFKDETCSVGHQYKFAAENFIREFALRNGVATADLEMDAPCSGAGDVRVVYADNKGCRIALRAV